MKKKISYLLLIVMITLTLAGCNNSAKQNESLFAAVENAAKIEKCEYEVSADIKFNDEQANNIKFVVKGKKDGNKVTIGALVNFLFFEFNIDEIMVVTEDAAYLNVEDIVKNVNNIITLMGSQSIDLNEMLGVSVKRLELPFSKELLSTMTTDDYVNLSTQMLQEALKDVTITDTDETHTVIINNIGELLDIVKNLLDSVVAHKEEIKNILTNANVNEAAIKDTIDLYINDILKAVNRVNVDLNLGLTEESIKELEDEMKGELNDLFDGADYENALDEMKTKLDESFAELEDNIDEIKKALDENKDDIDVDLSVSFSNSLTGKNGSRVYTTELAVNMVEEDTDLSLIFNGKMTENKKISIAKPDDSLSFEDACYYVIKMLAENDGNFEIFE